MVCRTVITSITQRYQKLKTFPKFSFWSKLIETHKVMFNLNKGFTNPHPYASKPLDWPLLSRGIAFSATTI